MNNLDRLKTAYAAWNDTRGRSRDVWGAMMADPFQLNLVDENSPGLNFARDAVSRDEALNYLTAIFDEWEMEHYTPETYVSEGDQIAMFGTCCFRHKMTGKPAELRMACLWRFEDGKAVSLVEILDSAVAAAAATP